MTLEEAIKNEDIVITVGDARNFFKGCIPGWRSFAEDNGFDWPTVVRRGLLASELYNTNNPMAISLVEYCYGK